jgi:hypothetical protein
MTLEQRLSEVLHKVDDFEPSPDLFARVNRSLEEDQAHRRRAVVAWLSIVASVAAIIVYLGLFTSRSPDGFLVIRVWVVELLETVVLVAIVLVLAPVIRRFGGLYVADVFRLDPGTGDRFLRLLDIAYYLVFFGGILEGVSLRDLDLLARVGPELESALERLGAILLVMGLFHAATLLALPVVGLVFSSNVRRVERLQAGEGAGVASARATQADRIAARIVWGLAALLVVGALVGVGTMVGLGLAG